MKKTKRSSANPSLHTPNPKGQKLPYAKLRVLVIETIHQSNSPSWTSAQLIKKLKIANGKPDVVRVLDALVKQGKLAHTAEGV